MSTHRSMKGIAPNLEVAAGQQELSQSNQSSPVSISHDGKRPAFPSGQTISLFPEPDIHHGHHHPAHPHPRRPPWR
jgi:hypothetical protein